MIEYGSLTRVKNTESQELAVTNNTNFNGVYTVVLTCDWGSIGTYLPAPNSAYPSNSNYLLTNSKVERLAGDLAKLNLTYTAQYDSLPTTTVVEQSSQERAPIEQHPNYATWQADPTKWDSVNKVLIGNKAGITDYIVGTTTVTKTEYFSSQPSSNRANIGKLQSPGSGYSESHGWLVIGTNRAQQGIFWVRVTTYLFSAVGFDTDIYSAV